MINYIFYYPASMNNKIPPKLKLIYFLYSHKFKFFVYIFLLFEHDLNIFFLRSRSVSIFQSKSIHRHRHVSNKAHTESADENRWIWELTRCVKIINIIINLNKSKCVKTQIEKRSKRERDCRVSNWDDD